MPSNQIPDVKKHWETMHAAGSKQPPLEELREIIDNEWTKLTAESGGVDYAEFDLGDTPAMCIAPKSPWPSRVDALNVMATCVAR